MKRVECHSLDDVGKLAQAFLDSLVPTQEGATLVVLQGDLGAGKTAFVKEVARTLGITEHVTSPTFVIEKRYALSGGLFENLVHIDAYRMESAHELEVLGWRELLKEPHTLVMVEWPERVEGSIPQTARVIVCVFVDETTRAFTL